jgi:hypothetical protein
LNTDKLLCELLLDRFEEDWENKNFGRASDPEELVGVNKHSIHRKSFVSSLVSCFAELVTMSTT